MEKIEIFFVNFAIIETTNLVTLIKKKNLPTLSSVQLYHTSLTLKFKDLDSLKIFQLVAKFS